MKRKEPKQVRIFVLRENDHLEKKLFRLKQGHFVQFVVSGGLFSRHVRLYCNHPLEGEEFDRHKYNKLRWQNPEGYIHVDFNKYAAVELRQAGTFHYYFTIDNSKERCGSGYILVDPILRSADESEISLDSLQCQTVLSKCLGPFPEWVDRINVTINSGFNMIHFTPLQELSHQSNSSYAIHDHLKYNPSFGNISKGYMRKLIHSLYEEYNLMSVTDLVYNHVATGCPLLAKHPEVAYNLSNSPHLRPSFLFDRIIHYFSKSVGEGAHTGDGIPSEISSSHLYTIRQYLFHHVLPKYKFDEFVTVDVNKAIDEFRCRIKDSKNPKISSKDINVLQVAVIQDPKYRRNGCSVDIDAAVKFVNASWDDVSNEDERIGRCCDILQAHLHKLNNERRNKITNDVCAGVDSCISHCRYWFFESGDPNYKRICESTPLAPRYFVYPYDAVSAEEDEKRVYGSEKVAEQCMAYNGWTANNDPLRSFADVGSDVYIRRELIVWNDLVKVRYGDSIDDCPALWDYMKRYTIDTVEVFKAVRLDNCHSTPIQVAEYMLDAARKLSPDLYIFGELFTGSEDLDNIFVNRLGITSLVRESMSSYNAYDFGRQIHRYGGQSVGAFYHPPTRPIVSGIAHAIFYDVTHDNMCPITAHSIYDLLPRMCLTNMACCSTGSSRGYDELVPHHIDVVTEKRLYAKWQDKRTDSAAVDGTCGIIEARRAANRLHMKLREEGFTQIYVDQVTTDVIAVTRHNPNTHNSIVLIGRTAFLLPDNPDHTGYIRPLFVAGRVSEVIFEACMDKMCDENCEELYKRDDHVINGLPQSTFRLNIRHKLEPAESHFIDISQNDNDDHSTYVNFKKFTAGSVIALRVSLYEDSIRSIQAVRQAAEQFNIGSETAGSSDKHFMRILSKLSLVDLNRVLYRCSEEEIDDRKGSDVYNIPSYGPLTYAGLQGFMSVLENVRLTNDMGHPICENLRNGNWILDYIGGRLLHHRPTQELGKWFLDVFEHFKLIPRFLIPAYFDAILTGAYSCAVEHIWLQMPKFIRNGSTLLRALSMVSVQLIGHVKSSPMPPLSNFLPEPRPERYICDEDKKTHQLIPSMSAGLRHFSTGAFRNWGRDTFISVRGLFLLTDRNEEARYTILSFGQCLRHGLIPNLLGSGIGARYNCRDAFWWWLHSIKCYTQCVHNGHTILKDPCAMLYPTDESPACEPGHNDLPLADVIHLGLRRHVQRMRFRERGAGYNLDNNMNDAGFNVEVGVDFETGFVYGGNCHNCGTWMDKMGSSAKAGNKGVPATPRDGSAVEIVGLSKACLDWLVSMNEDGYYPYNGIEYQSKGHKHTLRLADWAKLIGINFEKHFWIGEDEKPSEANNFYVNRTGIYKDSVKSSGGWTDYQFRPNFLVALVVAPEMVNVEHAWVAITKAEQILMGHVGMKTLDPSDLNYVADYDNSNDSTDKKFAHGWGYHQGPEWLWLTGYLYRAMLTFASLREGSHPGCLSKSLRKAKIVLGRLHDLILNSSWKGLPELTNANGAYCPFSCDTQAWSAASLLELMQHVSGIV